MFSNLTYAHLHFHFMEVYILKNTVNKKHVSKHKIYNESTSEKAKNGEFWSSWFFKRVQTKSDSTSQTMQASLNWTSV